MNYSPDPVRAEGPAAVTEGTPDGPTVLVLDPTGLAKHEGLPATWRDKTDRWRIVWCRLPSDGGLTQADDLLSDPPGEAVHVVASAPFADGALRLAEKHARALRSVLLVDPAADQFVPPGDGEIADRHWVDDHRERIDALAQSGVHVRVVAHSTGGADDRIPAPLPLGHPDVVAGVEQAIAELEKTH
ncbi:MULTISPECIES: hypothetical protein [Amycolatopsis]|uniref:Uncharacterized protein n=1 Tax=Amycolatopsis thermalba TaxID=944492 RepID=A0ABY4P018_9PSEU|nr:MULTISPECIES: hypothetical protein [Amycolatopsis]OXM65171.1 hypothetical protein CF166_28695 [Amycolatopsis sp. KNN50.9b]UQS25626.1 hypothetical protein L1857_23885 [Amycolatopsis thermalba]